MYKIIQLILATLFFIIFFILSSNNDIVKVSKTNSYDVTPVAGNTNFVR